MNKDLTILLEIFKRTGISITDFCNKTSIDRNRFYSWKKGRGNPKANDSELIRKWIQENTDKALKIDSMTNKPIGKEEVVQNDGQQEKSLHALIESNKMLVETNKDLTGMLKQSYYNKANSNSDQHISATLLPYLKKLALGGVGRFWKDENVGMIELNTILVSQLKAEVKLGN